MITRKSAIDFLIVLACSLALAGCKDSEAKKAREEAVEAKMLLTKAKADLVQVKGQRDALKKRLEAAELAHDELAEDLEQFIRQQDSVDAESQAAQDTIKNLTTLLDEQTKKVETLQNNIDQLQATIEQLQTTIEQQQTTITELQQLIEQLRPTAPEQEEAPGE